MTENGSTADVWAEWLLRGRQQGMAEAETRRMQRQLQRLRDRVLRGGHLRAGARVLDVGAGTGLIALAARQRVGPAGRVYALDLSRDALLAARDNAGSDSVTAPLGLLAGDATRLPFADASFDTVLTRSVLIYVDDKTAAAREFFRVLHPGGRASLFETINSAGNRYDWLGVREFGALKPDHERIRAYQESNWPHRAAMLDFTPQDLVDAFVAAGFTVELTYLHSEGATPAATARNRERRRALAQGMLARRPNPTLPSYVEAARAVLGDDAPAHLSRLVEILLDQPRMNASAVAYLVARKPRQLSSGPQIHASRR